MTDHLVPIVGIVISQKSHGKFYVWTKEAYGGNNGTLIMNPQKRVQLGDWVLMNFTPSEADMYFPTKRNSRAPKFRVSNYSVIPDIYPTESTDESTLRVDVEQYLMENQKDVYHHLFGWIDTYYKRRFPAGLHYLAIIRKNYSSSSAYRCWQIIGVNPIPENPGEGKIRITGIVIGCDSSYMYVWSKERPIGKDIVVKKEPNIAFELGTWMSLIVSKNQIGDDFLECKNYSMIPSKHLTTVKTKTISLELECQVTEGSENLSHPFVGDIINYSTHFAKTGKYLIEIFRKKPETWNGTESVWFLIGEPVLLEEVSQPQTGPPILPLTAKAMIIAKPIDRNVSVWLLEEHRDAILHLDTSSNNNWARPGAVFSAVFDVNNETWQSNGENFCIEEYKEVIGNENFIFKIHVNAFPKASDAQHFRCLWIDHEDFGHIIDAENQLVSGELVREIWMKRVKIMNDFRWVVVNRST